MLRSSRCFWSRFLKLSLCLLLGLILTGVPALGRSIYLLGAAEKPPLAIAATPSSHDLLDQGRQAYAAQRYTEAVAVWEEAAALFTDRPLQQALALSYLTAAYQQLSQWTDADRAITQSLDLLTTIPKSAQKAAVSAQIHNTLGSLQFVRGQTQAALETWQTAADLYAQTGDDARTINCWLNQVQSLQSLGFYRQARDRLSAIAQRLPEQSPELRVQGYQRLGHTYRVLGDFATAQQHLQTALTLAEQNSIATGAILLELGNTVQGNRRLGRRDRPLSTG